MQSGPEFLVADRCPTCGAMVFKDDTTLHMAWHNEQGVKASELAAALLANGEDEFTHEDMDMVIPPVSHGRTRYRMTKIEEPLSSLRDEVSYAMRARWSNGGLDFPSLTDTALAVVRRHVEAITPMYLLPDGTCGWLDRRDTLRLLGATDGDLDRLFGGEK